MICLVAWLWMSLPAWTPGHVQWQFSSVKRSSSESELVFAAVIDPGWHLYSHTLEPDGPKPTLFSFDKGEFLLLGDIQEDGEPKHVYDSTFAVNVIWYENKVVFKQMVRGKTGMSISGTIDYSVCSEERCVPGTVKFTISLKE
jgi:thiol:disulfide interchange protein DsbD